MRAHVQYQERDLSVYVSENSTVNTGLVVPSNKGRRDKVLLISGVDQLLADLTPNNAVEIGANLAIFTAKRIAAKGNLFIVNPKAKNCAYAGVLLNTNTEPTALSAPVTVDPEAFDFTNFSTNAVFIAADNQGTWGNDLRIRVLNYKEPGFIKEASGAGKFTFNNSQKWGDGYPVTVYRSTGLSDLDGQLTYYIANTSDNKFTLHKTQKDAFEKQEAITSADLSKDTVISPAVNYTKVPNTSCIQVFKANNLNSPLAEYIVSLDRSARDLDNNTLFIEYVLHNTPYIQAVVNPANNDTILQESVKLIPLTQGDNGEAITTGDMIKALRLFENTNEYSITLFGDGGYTVPAFQQKLRELCQKRGDAVAITCAPIKHQKNPSTAAQDILNYRNFEQNIDSSWCTLYAPHIKIYDEDNDREVWAAPDGFVIEAILSTAANYELWYPVAGDRRGNVTALDTKVHFTDADQDLLYDNGINPIIFEIGRGIKIWGQKTLQKQPSMLDRLNVRLLMVTIGPAITKMLRSFLFEFNDEPTRAEAKAVVEDYMESILARRGVTFFQVICDRSNNSDQDINDHIMRLWLIICPNASVEKIVFPIAITRNGAKLEQIYQQI